MALVVFTGGARSGKSALAQELARVPALDGAHVVMAVFADVGEDEEMAGRVERHRQDRPAGVSVIEAVDSHSWLNAVAESDLLVVDCLGTLVTLVLNEVLQESVPKSDVSVAENLDVPQAAEGQWATLPPDLHDEVEARVDTLVKSILARPGDTIVVTNQVGDGVVPAFASGRLFRDILGRANRRLVAGADAAYLVVCGRALDIKALPKTVRWPED